MRYGNPSKKNRVVSTLKGHSIEFPGRGSVAKSDLPPADPKFPERATIVDDDGVVYVYVPAIVRAEVDQAGMQAETEIEEKDEPKGKLRPEDPTELQKQAFEAFDRLVAANERENFAGNGAPKPQAVEKALGYALTTGDIKDLWPKYQASKAS